MATERNPVTETSFEKDPPHTVTPASFEPRREPARRVNGGIEVTLYWNALDNSTTIEVSQSEYEETLHFTVAKERALEAFYHPFAHLPTATHDLIATLDT
jgi:hypothetical protein